MPAGPAYHAARRADPQIREARRRYNTAYSRALARLREEHRGRFAQLLTQQLTSDRADQLLVAARYGLDDAWREDPDG